MRLRTALSLALLLCAHVAQAQVELVDPDATARPRPPHRPKTRAVETIDPDDAVEPDEPEARPTPAEPRRRDRVDAGTSVGAGRDAGLSASADAGAPLAGTTAAPRGVVVGKGSVASFEVSTLGDAELDQLFARWRTANQSKDVKAEQEALASLVSARRLCAATNMDAWAMALSQAARAHEAAGDSAAAVELSLAATQLSPELPSAWAALGEVYLSADPSEVGRVAQAVKNAVVLSWQDPRFFRPFLTQAAAVAGLSLVVIAVCLTVVLALRRGFYFLYDFHFLFPRVAARWQTSALAVLLVLSPVVFRLGVVPALLGLFLATTLYMERAERVVVAVLVGALGFVAPASEWVVQRTAFAGTHAERLYLIERGGPGAQALAAPFKTLAAEGKASFAELYVLARLEQRRGAIDEAVRHWKQALTMSPQNGRARNNLGAAMLISGDVDNPRALWEAARNDEVNEAAPLINLARLYRRMYLQQGDAAAGDVDKANEALAQARTRDPAAEGFNEAWRSVPSIAANDFVVTMPLPADELFAQPPSDAGDRVRGQLSRVLVGNVPETLAWVYPALAALLVLAFGSLGRGLEAAKACNKCGRPVSRRGDPDVSPGSLMCTQCVNVFARKNVAAPSLKVRKQLEVARFQERIDRATSVLGFLFAGLGHAFGGWPVRGAFYGLAFSAGLSMLLLRHGVVRPPWDAWPTLFLVVPTVLWLVVVYLVALRGLRRRQG
jgi:tetratricopeptide (TPR) repeat protein